MSKLTNEQREFLIRALHKRYGIPIQDFTMISDSSIMRLAGYVSRKGK